MSPVLQRQLALVAVVSVLLGVLVGWLLFHRGGTRVVTQAGAASPATAGASTQASFDQFGLTAQLPHGWGASIRRGVLDLAAPDQSVSLTVSMANGRPDVHLVRRADRFQLKRIFHARILTRERSKIGTLPTLVTELVGRTRKGHPVRILSSGISTRWRTYSIQAFSVPQPPGQRALEFDTLLHSFRFREPK